MIYSCFFSMPFCDCSCTLKLTITVFVDAIDEASALRQSLQLILIEFKDKWMMESCIESNKYSCTYRFYCNHRESIEDYIRKNNPSLDLNKIEYVLSGNDSRLKMEYIYSVVNIMSNYIKENYLLYIEDNTVCSLIELNIPVFKQYGEE